MTKLQYDPQSPLAEFFVKTEIVGSFFIHKCRLGEFVISAVTGDISLRIRWKYTWLNHSDVKYNWTLVDKTQYITNVYMAVCKQWNGKILYCTSGTSDFAKRFQGKKLSFRIEIIPVDKYPDWNVTVIKPDLNEENKMTFVRWRTKFIQLYSTDTVAVRKCLGLKQAICRYQSNVEHEVGHLIEANDEYYQDDESDKADKLFGDDASALMNIGMELRERYLNSVNTMLNVIIPDTYFSLVSVTK